MPVRCWPTMALLALCGCALRPVPAPGTAAPAVVVQPVEVTTTYIAAYARRFARGQYAVVEVCVAPDGAVAATRVTQSSADRAFDEAAMNWARQARYYPQLENGRPVYGCREVRVEVNPHPGPRVMGGADSALG
jgi:TonB family protein